MPAGQSYDSLQFNTLDTQATASLPPNFTVKVAQSGNKNDKDEDIERIRSEGYKLGAEALSDAWVKSGETAGYLDFRWTDGVKRRRLNGDVKHLGSYEDDSFQSDDLEVSITGKPKPSRGRGKSKPPTGDDRRKHDDVRRRLKKDEVPLWYTIPLKFPCSCQLERWQKAFSPKLKPPLTKRLLTISLDDCISGEIGQFQELPPWESVINNDDSDLDPSLDNLEEFEYEWRDIIPGKSDFWKNQGEAHDLKADLPKGKHGELKAISTMNPFKIPAKSDNAREGDKKDQDGRDAPQNEEIIDYEAEAKRRKSVWRKMIRDDEGFGRIWSVIPHHKSIGSNILPSTTRSDQGKNKRKLTEFILPRALLTTSHPFQSNLSQYIRDKPLKRVYWSIPIHGPIIIPLLTPNSDNFPPPFGNLRINRNDGPTHSLSPSFAILKDTHDQLEKYDPSTRPFPILWTSSRLKEFIDLFVDIQEKQVYGHLRIYTSGPKPDPFLSIPDDAYSEANELNGKKVEERQRKMRQAVSVEAGDHLRIYCDAKYCLSFRRWLYDIKLKNELIKEQDVRPLQKISDKVEGVGNVVVGMKGTEMDKEKSKLGNDDCIRIFNKTRLALVGSSGQVLVVA